MDKALEAAVAAYDESRCKAHGGDKPMSERNRETIAPMIHAAIMTYLAALPATDTSGLVERLMGLAESRVEHWEDWAESASTAMREAADRIEALERRLASSETALQCALIREGNEKHSAEISRQHMNIEIGLREKAVAWATEQHREADRYAARLAEADAALDMLVRTVDHLNFGKSQALDDARSYLEGRK